MEAETLNRVDRSAIPAAAGKDLCKAAIELTQRHRDDRAYQERYQAWLCERHKEGKKGTQCKNPNTLI